MAAAAFFVLVLQISAAAAQNVSPLPFWTSSPVEGGTEYRFAGGSDSVEFKMFDPVSDSFAFGTVDTDGTLFVPEGGQAVVYTVDAGGKRGPAVSLFPVGEEELEPQFTVLNPVPGNWNNAQSLVVESSPSTEIYYSLTSSDPLESGFAYDGPVLIENTGRVELNIAAVSASGKEVRKKIEYTVAPVATVTDACVVPDADGSFPVPETALYSTGGNTVPYIPGRPLKFAGITEEPLYVPVTVRQNGFLFRYVLFLGRERPPDGNTFSPPDGIKIHDWNFVDFTFDGEVFYSFDNSSWQRYSGPFFVDRSEDQTVYWYTGTENAQINKHELPAKPSIDGLPPGGLTNKPADISLDRDGYAVQYVTGSVSSYPEENGYVFLSDEPVRFDTIYGNEQTYDLTAVVYHNGIRQGTVSTVFTIDKAPPMAPVFISSAQAPYSREPVSVTVQGEGDVFVSLETSGIEFGFTDDTDDTVSPAAVSGFEKNGGETVVLPGNDGPAVMYTLAAYASDSAGNTSVPAKYTVTVDRNNFYVAFSAEKGGDGSPGNPFASVSDAFALAGKRGFTRIHLGGTVFAEAPLEVTSRVELTGSKNSRIDMGTDAFFDIAGGSLEVSDCFIDQSFAVPESPGPDDLLARVLFRCSGGVLKMEDCVIVSSGSLSGIICSASGSQVSVSDTDITVQAEKYASVISASDSLIQLDNVRGTVIAQTVSVFSVSAGRFSLLDSLCTMTAERALAGEFFGADISLAGNSFVLSVSGKKRESDPFRFDGNAVLKKTEGNSFSGFSVPAAFRS